MPPLLEPVLNDYRRSIVEARDSDVLNLLAATVDKLRDLVANEVPRVLDAVFEPTLRMITRNFEDFPEHRLAFFKLLKAVNTHCFAALFAIPVAHHKLVVDSVVWAFKHTERNVADTGLEILYELLLNVGRTVDDAKQPFYRAFVLPLIQDVLAVMTDRLHKSGFKTVPKPNLQPDFNVRVFECFDTSSSAGLRELDESDRSVQKSAESTSI